MLPSELARLVLAYLHEESCPQAAQSFLKESKHLIEVAQFQVKRQSKFKYDGRTLWQLAQEFVEIRDSIESRSDSEAADHCCQHVGRAIPSNSISTQTTSQNVNTNQIQDAATSRARAKNAPNQLLTEAVKVAHNVNNFRPRALVPVDDAPYLAPTDPTLTSQCDECQWQRRVCRTCKQHRRRTWPRYLADQAAKGVEARQTDSDGVSQRSDDSTSLFISSPAKSIIPIAAGLTEDTYTGCPSICTTEDGLSTLSTPKKISPRRKTDQPRKGHGKSSAPRRMKKAPSSDPNETIMVQLLEEMLNNQGLQNKMADKINEAVFKPPEPPKPKPTVTPQLPESLLYGETIDEIMQMINQEVVTGPDPALQSSQVLGSDHVSTNVYHDVEQRPGIVMSIPERQTMSVTTSQPSLPTVQTPPTTVTSGEQSMTSDDVMTSYGRGIESDVRITSAAVAVTINVGSMTSAKSVSDPTDNASPISAGNTPETLTDVNALLSTSTSSTIVEKPSELPNTSSNSQSDISKADVPLCSGRTVLVDQGSAPEKESNVRYPVEESKKSIPVADTVSVKTADRSQPVNGSKSSALEILCRAAASLQSTNSNSTSKTKKSQSTKIDTVLESCRTRNRSKTTTAASVVNPADDEGSSSQCRESRSRKCGKPKRREQSLPTAKEIDSQENSPERDSESGDVRTHHRDSNLCSRTNPVAMETEEVVMDDAFTLAMSPESQPSSSAHISAREDAELNVTNDSNEEKRSDVADGGNMADAKVSPLNVSQCTKQSKLAEPTSPRRKSAVRMLFQVQCSSLDKIDTITEAKTLDSAQVTSKQSERSKDSGEIVEESTKIKDDPVTPQDVRTNLDSPDSVSTSPEVKDDILSCHIEDSLTVEVHRVVLTDSPSKRTRAVGVTRASALAELVKEDPDRNVEKEAGVEKKNIDARDPSPSSAKQKSPRRSPRLATGPVKSPRWLEDTVRMPSPSTTPRQSPTKKNPDHVFATPLKSAQKRTRATPAKSVEKVCTPTHQVPNFCTPTKSPFSPDNSPRKTTGCSSKALFKKTPAKDHMSVTVDNTSSMAVEHEHPKPRKSPKPPKRLSPSKLYSQPRDTVNTEPKTPECSNLSRISLDNSLDEMNCVRTVSKSLFELLSDSPQVQSRTQTVYRWSTPNGAKSNNSPVRVDDSNYDNVQADAVASILEETSNKPRRLAIWRMETPEKDRPDDDIIGPEQECAIASILNLTPVKQTPVKANPIRVQGYDLSPPRCHVEDSLDASCKPLPKSPVKEKVDFLQVTSPMISLDESHQTEWNRIIYSAEKERLPDEVTSSLKRRDNVITRQKLSQNDTLADFASGNLQDFEFSHDSNSMDAEPPSRGEHQVPGRVRAAVPIPNADSGGNHPHQNAVNTNTQDTLMAHFHHTQPSLGIGNETMNDLLELTLDMLPPAACKSGSEVSTVRSVVGEREVACPGSGPPESTSFHPPPDQTIQNVTSVTKSSRIPIVASTPVSSTRRGRGRGRKKSGTVTAAPNTETTVMASVQPSESIASQTPTTRPNATATECLYINGKKYEAIPISNTTKVTTKKDAAVYSVSADEWQKIKSETQEKPPERKKRKYSTRKSKVPVPNAADMNQNIPTVPLTSIGLNMNLPPPTLPQMPYQPAPVIASGLPGAAVVTLASGVQAILAQQDGRYVPYVMTQSGLVRLDVPVVQPTILTPAQLEFNRPCVRYKQLIPKMPMLGMMDPTTQYPSALAQPEQCIINNNNNNIPLTENEGDKVKKRRGRRSKSEDGSKRPSTARRKKRVSKETDELLDDLPGTGMEESAISDAQYTAQEENRDPTQPDHYLLDEDTIITGNEKGEAQRRSRSADVTKYESHVQDSVVESVVESAVEGRKKKKRSRKRSLSPVDAAKVKDLKLRLASRAEEKSKRRVLMTASARKLKAVASLLAGSSSASPVIVSSEGDVVEVLHVEANEDLQIVEAATVEASEKEVNVVEASPLSTANEDIVVEPSPEKEVIVEEVRTASIEKEVVVVEALPLSTATDEIAMECSKEEPHVQLDTQQNKSPNTKKTVPHISPSSLLSECSIVLERCDSPFKLTVKSSPASDGARRRRGVKTTTVEHSSTSEKSTLLHSAVNSGSELVPTDAAGTVGSDKKSPVKTISDQDCRKQLSFSPVSSNASTLVEHTTESLRTASVRHGNDAEEHFTERQSVDRTTDSSSDKLERLTEEKTDELRDKNQKLDLLPGKSAHENVSQQPRISETVIETSSEQSGLSVKINLVDECCDLNSEGHGNTSPGHINSPRTSSKYEDCGKLHELSEKREISVESKSPEHSSQSALSILKLPSKEIEVARSPENVHENPLQTDSVQIPDRVHESSNKIESMDLIHVSKARVTEIVEPKVRPDNEKRNDSGPGNPTGVRKATKRPPDDGIAAPSTGKDSKLEILQKKMKRRKLDKFLANLHKGNS